MSIVNELYNSKISAPRILTHHYQGGVAVKRKVKASASIVIDYYDRIKNSDGALAEVYKDFVKWVEANMDELKSEAQRR